MTKNGKYFWRLNLLVFAAVFALTAHTLFFAHKPSPFRAELNEYAHYAVLGFDLNADFYGGFKAEPGRNVGAIEVYDDDYSFLTPGAQPTVELTIFVPFDYSPQYDALAQNPGAVPAIKLPGLGDNFQIYLNGNLIAEQWHAENGEISLHKLARGEVFPINPAFFERGENLLAFRVLGEAATIDTGLAVTRNYAIDRLDTLSRFDYPQIFFAGLCLAVSLTFFIFFLLHPEKTLNLWFAITAFSVSSYTLFRAGAFAAVIANYQLALRLELAALFSFAFFMCALLYACGKERFNLGMKAAFAVYMLALACLLLPGHRFVIDLSRAFFALFAPFIVYAFFYSLCLPFFKDLRASGFTLQNMLQNLSGTLRGNVLFGAVLPIAAALFDLTAYLTSAYSESALFQYGFLFFFANVTYALALDIARMHYMLISLSGELKDMVDLRERELALKSGEVEQVKSAQTSFNEMVAREIRAPLGEIIGSIELQILSSGASAGSSSWLGRLLDAEKTIRKKLDSYLFEQEAQDDGPAYSLPLAQKDGGKDLPGQTRHLFVINPKSFVTLKDLKNFLLSIETCFSTGHRAEYKIYISRYPRDAYAAVHRYLSATPARDTVRVYAVGGDGILFDCLNGLACFKNAELAPIPYGNANDFVRSFGQQNLELFRDIKLMSKAPSRLVDMMECGRHYAICSCSIGIEARAVQIFSNATEKISTGKARDYVPLIYKLGAAKALFDGSMSGMSYRVDFDGHDLSGDYLIINVGNIALNGGNNCPNPLADPEDGLLDVILCKPVTPLKAVRMLPAYTAGRFERFPDALCHRRIKEMRCQSDRLMSVILDGETFYTHEIDLKILPKAVKIVSPNGIGFASFASTAKGDT